MKTNVVLKSEDRILYGTTIKQETKTGFLNLSDLQKAYDQEAFKNGWSIKRIENVLASKDNHERIYYILEKQGVINTGIHVFMEMVQDETPTKLLKKLKAYKTTGARQTKTSWCNPYIWVLIALEMNPKFYAEVVTWLTDSLIINRIEAGNFYRALSASISKFNPNGNQYKELAKALNYVVFNRHETAIRDTANSKQLKELEDLEKKMSFAIDMGYIKSFDVLLEELRKVWRSKYNQRIN